MNPSTTRWSVVLAIGIATLAQPVEGERGDGRPLHNPQPLVTAQPDSTFLRVGLIIGRWSRRVVAGTMDDGEGRNQDKASKEAFRLPRRAA